MLYAIRMPHTPIGITPTSAGAVTVISRVRQPRANQKVSKLTYFTNYIHTYRHTYRQTRTNNAYELKASALQLKKTCSSCRWLTTACCVLFHPVVHLFQQIVKYL